MPGTRITGPALMRAGEMTRPGSSGPAGSAAPAVRVGHRSESFKFQPSELKASRSGRQAPRLAEPALP